MKTDLLLHERTRKQLESAINNPAHAIGIIGAAGTGKTAVATLLARQILGKDSLEHYGYFRVVSPEKDSITIEQARDIVAYMKLKTTGNQQLRRVLIIEHAETMTREAQNAVLKIIEEPPIDTVIIMTISSKQAVLPTIISRLQTLTVTAPILNDVTKYFENQDFATSDIQRAYSISNGNMGLLHALLREDSDHPLLAHIEQAKNILKADTFERLVMIDEITKNKQIPELLYGLQQTAQSALLISASNNNADGVKRWQHILKVVYEARELLNTNTQSKLVLTNLLVRM